MARNRIIKPEFFTSEKLSSISPLSNLFFIGILIHCDDYGVCINNNRRLIGDIFPLRESITEKDIERTKLELLKIGVIISAEKGEKKYLIVKNWKEHQKVEKPSKRRYLNDCEIEHFLKTLPDSVPETLPDSVEKFSETLPAPMLINNGNVNVNGSVNVSLSDSPTESKSDQYKQEFEIFRKAFTGTKNGLDTEFENFTKKNKNYKDIIPLLLPAIQRENDHRAKAAELGEFFPISKSLSVWINKKCWEQELPIFTNKTNNTTHEYEKTAESQHDKYDFGF